MAFPKPDQDSQAFFDALVPDDPRVSVRPMFGNFAAFANGNMFLGLFGPDVFVRLPEDARGELLQEDGASMFEPFPGRAMKEYVGLPRGWRERQDDAAAWVARSLDWVGAMPEKKKKPRKKKTKG